MKRILLVMVCIVFSFSMMYAQETKKKSNREMVTFLVENMHCQNCVNKIEKNIVFEKGVTDLKCDLKTQMVEVTFRADKTTEDKLIAAFDRIGMKAKALAEGEEAGAHNQEGDVTD